MYTGLLLVCWRARQVARATKLALSRRRPFPILIGILIAACASAGSLGVTYTYDALGRLTVSAYDNGSRTTYSLDAAGNRKSITQTIDTTAPAAPTGLAGTATSTTNINLTWNACTDSSGALIAGYNIYRAGVLKGTSASASYSDSTVVANTTYAYTVACFDNAGNSSAQSSPVNVTTPAALPSVPTGLAGTAPNATTVNLTWTASTDTGGPGLAGYKIYRGGTQIGTSATTSYSDTTVVGSTTYTYTVAAYDTAGNTSAQGAGVNVTTPASIPSVPPGTPSPNGIVTSAPWTESWTASSGPVSYYVVKAFDEGKGTTKNTNVTAPAISLSGQTTGNGDTVDYSVQACNASNQCSAFGNTAYVTRCNGGTCP